MTLHKPVIPQQGNREHPKSGPTPPVRPSATDTGRKSFPLEKLFVELTRKTALIQQRIRSVEGRKVQIGQQSVISFVSASYLGLERDQRVVEAASRVAASWGFSLGMPRLLAFDPFTKALENELASFLGLEHCLVFPSTTHAALDIVPTAAGQDGAVFVDDWTYPTLWEGIHAAARVGARIFRFPHSSLSVLARQLRSARNARNRIILCDGVYPEGGAPAPILEMAFLAERFGGWLCVDDSHGLGVLGRQPIDRRHPYGRGGGGVARYFDLSVEKLLVMGTLSKALGIPLAFVAGSEMLLRKTEAKSASFVHSSPPSLPNVAAGIAALRIAQQEGDDLRERVGQLVRRFQAKLRENSIPVLSYGLFPIQTIPFRTISLATEAGRNLRQRGIWSALQFSPPDQPEKGVLRFFVTALHTPAQVDLAAEAIVQFHMHLTATGR